MEGAAARLNMLPDAATAGHSAAEPTERMDVAVQAASLPDAPDARLTTPPPASAHPDLVIPPLNFSMVNKGVYRSGYPNPKNFTFLRRLGLRSILYLGSDKYRAENQQFLRTCRLQFFHCPIEGNKEPFLVIPEDTMCAALRIVMDSRNHPILIHCYKGQYQTGCVVGCLRKLQQWSLTSIFDEYRRFARSTIRVLDQQFIEQFPVHALLDGAAQLASEAPAPAGAAAAGGRRDSVTGGGDGGGGGGGGGGSAAEVQGGKGREPALS